MQIRFILRIHSHPGPWVSALIPPALVLAWRAEDRSLPRPWQNYHDRNLGVQLLSKPPQGPEGARQIRRRCCRLDNRSVYRDRPFLILDEARLLRRARRLPQWRLWVQRWLSW